MRLIDAEKENAKLLDFIAQNDTAIAYAIEHKDMTMLEGIFTEYFEAQETAYDVEKVVAEIAEKAQKYCDAVGCKNCYTDCEHYFLMQSIIASVVKGGVE